MRVVVLAAALAMQGCAALGYSEVGIYFQHGTDVNKSFALQWMRDAGKGNGYREPDCDEEPVVGVPSWMCYCMGSALCE